MLAEFKAAKAPVCSTGDAGVNWVFQGCRTVGPTVAVDSIDDSKLAHTSNGD